MRAGFSPLEPPTASQVILENLIGENCGNMLFPYSIMRTLMRKDTEIKTISVNRFFSRKQISQWNSEYDCFVIPLANAFRDSFLMQLKYITTLVTKLTIPCIVIGVGLQADIHGNRETSPDFDHTVSSFIKAVLKKSSLIGIRGEFTANYLKRLGFTEEKDFTVIGCPSMYLHGPNLPCKPVKSLKTESNVSINCKIKIPAKLHKFIFSSAKQFAHYTYIPQGIDDLLLLYAGVSIDRNKFSKIHKGYPWQLHSRICASGCEAGFTDVRSWLEFLNGVDFSFGTRIHGNIAAILAGTPAFIFAPDGRIVELARYHQIQHMAAEQIKESTDIFEVYEHADFTSVQQGHKQRFAHYADFLEQNGLKHIYMPESESDICPFDEKIAKIPQNGPLKPFNKLPLKEQAERLQTYYAFLKANSEKKDDQVQWIKMVASFLPDTVREKLIQYFLLH